jgi:hypothetical protein
MLILLPTLKTFKFTIGKFHFSVVFVLLTLKFEISEFSPGEIHFFGVLMELKHKIMKF